MLAAIEDLLDSFPGTLLVVSHDRYLVERVTDQQYAVIDGGLRHLPRGVDQYLELRAAGDRAKSRSVSTGSTTGAGSTTGVPKLGGAELRNTQKELAAATRKMEKLAGSIAALHERMAVADQSDFAGLSVLMAETAALEGELAGLELRWLELSDLLGG